MDVLRHLADWQGDAVALLSIAELAGMTISTDGATLTIEGDHPHAGAIAQAIGAHKAAAIEALVAAGGKAGAVEGIAKRHSPRAEEIRMKPRSRSSSAPPPNDQIPTHP